MQKEAKEELPPTIGSSTFSRDAARKLVAGKGRRKEGYEGYDAIDYRLTRFDGVSRVCSIPHPKAYAGLAICLYDSWDKIKYVAENTLSYIRPREHPDGRIIIMDYETSIEMTRRSIQGAFGQRFLARTDISNCYPTIYSHAITWAAVGHQHAKRHKSSRHATAWFNQLDKNVRKLRRNETLGVAIGPATSNIVSEIILAKVDEALKRDFLFSRFIDDYSCFCKTEDDAREFVRRLAEELARFKLVLNEKKTEIVKLPRPFSEEWIAELALRLPKAEVVRAAEALKYMDFATMLAKETPDGSVLKYALKSLAGSSLEAGARAEILRYGLTLSFHQPVLLPVLNDLFDETPSPGGFPFSSELLGIAAENARTKYSDGLAWSLYYLNKFGIAIDELTAGAIIASRDCIALLLLYYSNDPSHQSEVVKFTETLDNEDLYELDQYWLLLYQLYRDGRIPSSYPDEDAFEILESEGVTFVTKEQVQ